MRRIVAAGCLGLVLAGATGAAVAAPLTMMPVRLLDTSGEGGDHAARQALMGDALAVAWAERVGARRTVLTHMGHDLDWAWLRRRLPPGMEPGHDGQVLELPG